MDGCDTPTVSSKLDETMVLVQVTVNAWNGLKTDNEATADFTVSKDAESGAGAFRKVLIKDELLQAIHREAGRARNLIYSTALPWIGGAYILPAAMMEELNERLEKVQHEFFHKVAEFVGQYDRLKAEGRKRLGKLYSEADYPDASTLSERFHLNIVWQPIGPTHPEQMKLVDDIARKIAASAADAQRDAADRAKRDLGERIKDVVTGFAASLESFEAKLAVGEKGIIRQARLDALDDLHKLVRNSDFDGSGDNYELAEMIDKLRETSVESLKIDEDHRRKARAQADAISARMKFWS